jgi:hypothetical protein
MHTVLVWNFQKMQQWQLEQLFLVRQPFLPDEPQQPPPSASVKPVASLLAPQLILILISLNSSLWFLSADLAFPVPQQQPQQLS